MASGELCSDALDMAAFCCVSSGKNSCSIAGGWLSNTLSATPNHTAPRISTPYTNAAAGARACTVSVARETERKREGDERTRRVVRVILGHVENRVEGEETEVEDDSG